MNHPTPLPSRWLEHTELEGEDGIIGNRAGFELLRQSIDRLLEGTAESLSMDGEEICLRQLKLCEPPPPTAPTAPDSFLDNLLIFGVAFSFLILIPLLALFGLYQLIQILSA